MNEKGIKQSLQPPHHSATSLGSGCKPSMPPRSWTTWVPARVARKTTSCCPSHGSLSIDRCISTQSKHRAADKHRSPRVLFVLGGPGSGKGTQCALLERRYDWKHLSAGSLLREEVERGGPHASAIRDAMDQGAIVPARITTGLLWSEMKRNASQSMFLIDGFPRNQENLSVWSETMSERARLVGAVYFRLKDEDMVKRVEKRLHSSLHIRQDDSSTSSIKRRIATFWEDTLPIINHFREHSVLHEVDASLDIPLVHEAVNSSLMERLAA